MNDNEKEDNSCNDKWSEFPGSGSELSNWNANDKQERENERE